MRVLMTTDTVGGVWTFTKELSRELLERGCAVAMVSLGRSVSAAQQAWVDRQRGKWGSQFRFDASDAPLEWMAENRRAFDEPEKLLRRVGDEFGAELLLTNQFCFGALKCEIPRIVVAHSDALSWAEACRPEGLPDSEWLRIYRELVQGGLSHADAVVAPTRWMLEALVAQFDVPSQRLVIANGRRIAPANAGTQRKLQAITAGRLWDEAKGLRMLERVVAPMPLLIAGETELESAQLQMRTNNTRFLGSLSEKDLLKVFRESAVYVCTSQYEPFGLAPLEAALCGCAVLANDIASLQEVWGDAALYFSGPGDLSKKLTTLAEDSSRLADAQTRALQRAQRFTTRRMADEYTTLFRTVRKEAIVGHYAA